MGNSASMASPRNSAESDKAIDESQEMTCCSIPPPPTYSSPLRSPYPWSPTKLPWSPSYLLDQSPTFFIQSSTDFLDYRGSNQSMESPPQIQQHEDIVNPTPVSESEMIFSIRMQLQNLQLVLQEIYPELHPQPGQRLHQMHQLLLQPQRRRKLLGLLPQLQPQLQPLQRPQRQAMRQLLQVLQLQLQWQPQTVELPQVMGHLPPLVMALRPPQVMALLQQSGSDALNLSLSGINMEINSIEHNSQGLYMTPALPPIIRTKLYIGVWQRQDGEWVAKIRDHKKWVNIGTFNTAEEAAVAHDRAAYMLRGRQARINFPELMGVSPSFLDKNKAEPTAAPIMEIEDSVLGWSEATGTDEIEAVGIEGEGTGEDEMAKAGLNSNCLGKGKRKVKASGEERETKKSGVRIEIPLEDILQWKGMRLEDAALNLDVSKSTLKRKCRDYGIFRWPPRKTNELMSNSFPTETPMDVDQDQIPQLSSNILPPNQTLASGDTNISVTVYARYENRITIKFRLSSPWRRVELEQQVERRLQLEAGTYYIKYKDVENDLISICCDEDLADCISDSRSKGASSSSSRSIGKSLIEVFVELK